MWSAQFIAQKSISAVKTHIKLDSHKDTCVVSDQCLVIHYYNRSLNVLGFDPNTGSKHDTIVDATVAYDKHKMGHVLILLRGI